MALDIFKKREETKDNWYAVFVETGQEDNVKERLKYRLGDKYKLIVPKRKLRERRQGKWEDKIKVLFPGYVLVNGYIEAADFKLFQNVPGLLKLLRVGHDPLKIEAHEMEVINKLIIKDDTIDFSSVIIENGEVIVVDGPLVSLQGYVVSVDKRKGRAKVMLDFLGEGRTVELGINVLQQR